MRDRGTDPGVSASSIAAAPARFLVPVGTPAAPVVRTEFVGGRRHRDVVVEVDGMEHREQVVVPVGAQVADGQVQVDLGRAPGPAPGRPPNEASRRIPHGHIGCRRCYRNVICHVDCLATALRIDPGVQEHPFGGGRRSGPAGQGGP